jgi:hypothetical protein
VRDVVQGIKHKRQLQNGRASVGMALSPTCSANTSQYLGLPIALLVSLGISRKNCISLMLLIVLSLYLLIRLLILVMSNMTSVVSMLFLLSGSALCLSACLAAHRAVRKYAGFFHKVPDIQDLLNFCNVFTLGGAEGLGDVGVGKDQVSIALLFDRSKLADERNDLSPFQVMGSRVLKDLLQSMMVLVT